MTRCPSCGEEPGSLIRDARAIARELAARRRFFARDRDLTDVVLGEPALILRCDRCGILVRDGAPDDGAFRDDRYSTAFLRSLHEWHSTAFRAKARDYREQLAPHARVVEVGSYAGGFLRAAMEWGWRTTGFDIGGDTSRFTTALGFDMHDAFDFAPRSIEALFVWNCFEQLSAPRELLAEAHRALREGGLLVLRVPDADRYVHQPDPRVLARNGLLGWPHRFGFGVTALRRLAREHGFALRRVLRRPPLPPLFAAEPGWLELMFTRSRLPVASRRLDLEARVARAPRGAHVELASAVAVLEPALAHDLAAGEAP
jgi:SAM-dependent methyltransferase